MPRETPYGAYNFIVEFDGNDPANSALGGFSDVSGISTEFTMMEYRQGNDKENRVRKIPGMHKAGDVTLKRGIMGQVNFWDWINITRTDPTHKRTVMITLQDEQRNPVLRWKLINARPLKFTGPTLAAKGSGELATEEFVVCCEAMALANE